MDSETFEGTIRTFKHRTPFQPFTVVTVSGGRYEVDHSEAIIVRGPVAVFIGPGKVPVIFDAVGVSEIVGDLSGNPAPT